MKKGFTLIELLISIAIIFILVGMSFAGYTRLSLRQNLTAAGLNLKNIIRDAQSRAYNNEIDCSKCGCNTNSSNLIGWYVDFTSKSIYGMCAGNKFNETFMSVSNDITINVNTQKILFKPSPGGSSDSVNICLFIASGLYYSLSVSTAGIITDNGIVGICTP